VSDGDDHVLYELRDDGVAVITLNRPEFANAQNSALLYRLDERFAQFADDDDARVAILTGKGRHFSSGHDLGPGADRDKSFDRRSLWWDHVGKQGVEARMAREQDVYLGLCRRWRELPKPTIAMVRGACVAGGLMLAWSCDLILASPDAYFADPTVAMGVPGVEFFAHPWIMGGRRAKEFLFLGERVFAEQARELGMVNRVFDADELEPATVSIAARIGRMPRMGLAFAKMAVNQSEDAMGMRVGVDSVFGLHHAAHAHNVEVSGSIVLGQTPERVRAVIEGHG
jgi:enoyl-CoA hydratase